jgi:hypothetical protein
MSETKFSTTPDEDLSYRLSKASLRLTYAKCLTGVLSDEADGLAGRTLSAEAEERIHALCHSMALMVEEASSLIDAAERESLHREDRP